MVAGLQAGMCFINNYNVSPVELPFGGYKKSGEEPESVDANPACRDTGCNSDRTDQVSEHSCLRITWESIQILVLPRPAAVISGNGNQASSYFPFLSPKALQKVLMCI